MTLKDLSTGPDWVQWAVLVIFALLSILFLSGRGSCLIAGYNTVFLFVMSVWEEALPAAIAYIFLALVAVDCVVMIVLMNTICKK